MGIQSSELILNDDGSIFHLKLFPGEVANNIILVGDPGRVELIAQFLDFIEFRKQNREFHTVTGTYRKKRITVISTGIGADNIDIVINELDALKNIDPDNRKVKDSLETLNIIRIGTSGSLQRDIPPGACVLTTKSIGFDNLPHFYRLVPSETNRKMESSLKAHLGWNQHLAYPYVADASGRLAERFKNMETIQGMTISATGFYGPQGRKLRIPLADEDLNNKIQNFQFENLRIANYEMESSAIYALSRALKHEALTLCVVIVNRITGEQIIEYKPIMENLVQKVLKNL